MLETLEQKIKERDSLWEDLKISLELNRLYGTEDEALRAGAYRIKNGGWVPREVYITVSGINGVKVFKATNEEFRDSNLSKMKIQTRGNHPYPGEPKQVMVDKGTTQTMTTTKDNL